MKAELIFYPVMVQIALTFIMYIRLSVVKSRALACSDVDLDRRALHDDAWPDYVLKTSNNIHNQFESPSLFYTLAIMLWALQAVTPLVLTAAWAYASLRIVHAFVHTGSNYVPLRKNLFKVSILLLIAMSVKVLISLTTGVAQ